jgi:uncharacterized membrane-anchored protein YhcB (DUF1043 family)
MAQEMSGEAIYALGGIFVGMLTVIFGWMATRGKSQVDESTLVLNKWKELVEAHQRQISTMVTEIADLRDRLVRAERLIVELKEENKGLRDQLIQHSRSAAMLIGDIHPTRNFRDTDEDSEDGI